MNRKSPRPVAMPEVRSAAIALAFRIGGWRRQIPERAVADAMLAEDRTSDDLLAEVAGLLPLDVRRALHREGLLPGDPPTDAEDKAMALFDDGVLAVQLLGAGLAAVRRGEKVEDVLPMFERVYAMLGGAAVDLAIDRVEAALAQRPGRR